MKRIFNTAIAGFLIGVIVFGAFAYNGEFVIARVKYSGGGDWYSDRTSIPNWLETLNKRTDIHAADDQVVTTLEDKALYQYRLFSM